MEGVGSGMAANVSVAAQIARCVRDRTAQGLKIGKLAVNAASAI